MNTQDTIEASTLKECVPKMIKHEMETHPEMPQNQAVAVAYKKCRERFGQTEGDSINLKNQVIASEGVLKYVDGNKLKMWDDLKLQVGTLAPIIDEHPSSNNGNNGLISGNEKVYGYGEIKTCPLGRKTICADAILDDDAPLKKGYSIGFTYNEEKQSGEYEGQKYDGIQHITGINHIALTDAPRNPVAVMVTGDSNSTPNSTQSKEQVVKYRIGYDSFKSFKFSRADKLMTKEDEEKSDLDSLKKEIAELKTSKKEFDATLLKVKNLEEDKIKIEAARVKAEGDSNTYKQRLEEEITKRVKSEVDSLVSEYKFDSKDFDKQPEDFIRGARFGAKHIVDLPGGSIINSQPAASPKEESGLDSVNDLVYNHDTQKMEKKAKK